MTPAEWASAANKLSRSNPGLNRAEIITKMNDQGMPRPTGVEGKGTYASGNPKFGQKTRSKGQTARRKQHEQTSTESSTDNLQRLRQWQETMNNMAAYAGMEEAHHEHYAPSDMTDMLAGEGAPGDYVANRPKSYSTWKTAFEQYIRTKRGNKYRLLETPEGVRIVDRRYADVRVDPYDLPGIDVDESMDVERVFSALPFIVGQNLSLPKTSFPGLPSLITEGLRTPPQTKLTPQALAGFPEMPEMGPTTSEPPTKYVPPVDMQYRLDAYTNGNGKDNGNGNGDYSDKSNGGPPKYGGSKNGGSKNGGGHSNGGSDFVDGLTSAVSVGAAVGTAVVGGLMSLPGALTTSGI